MHPVSTAIQQIIKATPGYSLEELAADLGIQKPETDGDKWVTSKDAAAYLGVSTRWLLELRKSGVLPAYVKSSEIRYKKSELDKVFKKERREN